MILDDTSRATTTTTTNTHATAAALPSKCRRSFKRLEKKFFALKDEATTTTTTSGETTPSYRSPCTYQTSVKGYVKQPITKQRLHDFSATKPRSVLVPLRLNTATNSATMPSTRCAYCTGTSFSSAVAVAYGYTIDLGEYDFKKRYYNNQLRDRGANRFLFENKKFSSKFSGHSDDDDNDDDEEISNFSTARSSAATSKTTAKLDQSGLKDISSLNELNDELEKVEEEDEKSRSSSNSSGGDGGAVATTNSNKGGEDFLRIAESEAACTRSVAENKVASQGFNIRLDKLHRPHSAFAFDESFSVHMDTFSSVSNVNNEIFFYFEKINH